ncbi:S1C family serine protease [Salinicoccus albus]|uniref:S1C family serine protease n=1 Tax=Salinicoccus albus TaxID=418756 RepID=UPI00035EAB03|nr:trypsin-like peptidase domain-containing protein [Salinicoccus albus]
MGKEDKHIIPRDQYRRRRRVFKENGTELIEHSAGDEANDREFGPDQHKRQDAAPESHASAPDVRREAVSGDNHSGSKPQENEDTEENTSAEDTEKKNTTADADQEYGYSETRAADNSASAAGTAGAASAGGSTAASGSGGSGSGGSGSGGSGEGGGGRGWLRSLFIPLIAGVAGALIVLLLYNVFDDGGGTEMADQSASEENTQKAGNIEQQGGGTSEEDADTSEAIQSARQSVVSVINLQRTSSFLPGLEEQPESGQQPGGGSEEGSSPEEAGTGSGVIYKLTEDSAYIVTNNHVVDGAEEVQINLQDGEQLQAEIVGSDLWTDLAVLRVDRGNIDSSIEFADSNNLQVGQTAIAIGSPLGQTFSGSVSRGIVSGLDRTVPVDIDGDGTYDWESNVIQTDAAINPGNSGGALIDRAGNLIGINAMKVNSPTVEGIGFAIPSNEVQEIVTQLEENGEVQRPFLGIMLQDLYQVPEEIQSEQMNLPEDVSEGVIVSNVESGSPAEAGGLEQLDVIVSLDGQAIPNMLELRQYLYYEKEQGEDMTIEYYRDGELQETTVTLD